ncbi:MAG: hypothetical protein Q9159_005175 [Coniocarpon cinnabarinum]
MGVPVKRTGKWLVAQDETQLAALENVESFSRDVDDGSGDGLGGQWGTGFKGAGLEDERAIPMRWIGRDEARRREPDVRAEAGVLESSSTGIVDSHGLMQALMGEFEDAGGTVALGSDVVRVDRSDRQWKVWTRDVDEAQKRAEQQRGQKEAPFQCVDPEREGATSISSETVINSAGLAAIALSNALLPPEHRRQPAYAKGTYFSYTLSKPKASTLIYPAPVPGHGGLGTHLTLDMGGRIRFGPDVEWVDDSNDYKPNEDAERFKRALDDIQSYFPRLDRSAVTLDYCGIRPKLNRGGSATAGKGFEDFYIRREDDKISEGATFVNLLGIESPGLTSSIAIGEYVYGLLYR